MDAILRNLTEILCNYGIWSAGLPSGHGSYEEEVPAMLVKQFDTDE